jgi:hypothetical protein
LPLASREQLPSQKTSTEKRKCPKQPRPYGCC